MKPSTAGSNGRLVRHELRQALRSGPFPAALHLAIEASELTLDQIQVWLAGHGVRLSATTLSYWRRGRSRPERAESLRAVRLLEQLLAVPKDSLVSLLGPRRSRGRWIGHVPGNLSFGTLMDDARSLQVLHKVGAPPLGALTRLSTQVSVKVGADGRTSSVRVRELVRANVDRVSRCGVVYSADEQPSDPPTLTGAKYCRVGRVAVDRSIGLIAGELILDRVLDAGEPALLKYSWTFSPRPRMLNYEHMFSAPRREFVLQVRFEPDTVPARCFRYDRRTVSDQERNHRDLWIGGSSTALLAELDVLPGIVGIRWEWPNSIG